MVNRPLFAFAVLLALFFAACGTSSTASVPVPSIMVTIHDNYFDPSMIVVTPDKPIPLTLVNVGTNVHLVEIKGLTPETTLEPGQRTTFTITAQAHSYKMYDEIYA